MAPYIINPHGRYKMLFDNFMGFMFLLCYLMDPYVVAFEFHPLKEQSASIFQRSVTYLIILDMILTLFTGLPKEEYYNMKHEESSHERENIKKGKHKESKKSIKRREEVARRAQFVQKTTSSTSRGLYDTKLERNFLIIVSKYCKKSAIPDLLANMPILIYSIIAGFPASEQGVMDYQKDPVFVICMIMKTLRLFHFYEVIESLTRAFEALADYFYLHRYLILKFLRWIVAATKFLLANHYFTCGWVII